MSIDFNNFFDPDDDRHRLVAKILNSQGRKIARYVARAVLAYHEERDASSYEEPPNNKRGKADRIRFKGRRQFFFYS